MCLITHNRLHYIILVRGDNIKASTDREQEERGYALRISTNG